MARDPAFKTQHSKDALKNIAATTREIGKRTAWVWTGEKKVVVPLGDDTAVIYRNRPTIAADAGGRVRQVARLRPPPVALAGVLAPAIRVRHQFRTRPATDRSHLQSLSHQPTRHRLIH